MAVFNRGTEGFCGEVSTWEKKSVKEHETD